MTPLTIPTDDLPDGIDAVISPDGHVIYVRASLPENQAAMAVAFVRRQQLIARNRKRLSGLAGGVAGGFRAVRRTVAHIPAAAGAAGLAAITAGAGAVLVILAPAHPHTVLSPRSSHAAVVLDRDADGTPKTAGPRHTPAASPPAAHRGQPAPATGGRGPASGTLPRKAQGAGGAAPRHLVTPVIGAVHTATGTVGKVVHKTVPVVRHAVKPLVKHVLPPVTRHLPVPGLTKALGATVGHVLGVLPVRLPGAGRLPVAGPVLRSLPGVGGLLPGAGGHGLGQGDERLPGGLVHVGHVADHPQRVGPELLHGLGETGARGLHHLGQAGRQAIEAGRPGLGGRPCRGLLPGQNPANITGC